MMENAIIETTSGISTFLEKQLGIVNAHHYFFLALLGTITATVCFLTDLVTVFLIDCKFASLGIKLYSETHDCAEPRFGVSHSLLHICGVCRSLHDDRCIHVVRTRHCILLLIRIFVSKEVEGSGIPEIKAILAGITIPKYLNLSTGIAKIFGLMSALIAGMPVGREGPFIHMSACIAQRMTKWQVF